MRHGCNRRNNVYGSSGGPYNTATRDFRGSSRLLIDLPAALSGNNESDYEVEDGDELIVPRSSDTVSVVGGKTRNAYFQAGLSVEDYISLSAGVAKGRRVGNLYCSRQRLGYDV